MKNLRQILDDHRVRRLAEESIPGRMLKGMYNCFNNINKCLLGVDEPSTFSEDKQLREDRLTRRLVLEEVTDFVEYTKQNNQGASKETVARSVFSGYSRFLHFLIDKFDREHGDEPNVRERMKRIFLGPLKIFYDCLTNQGTTFPKGLDIQSAQYASALIVGYEGLQR